MSTARKATPLQGYMTVRQVMKEIGARANSTVHRLIYDETKPRPEGKKFAASLVPGMGWLVTKASVEDFKLEERLRSRGVGFPRGKSRKAQPPKPARKARAG